MCVTHEYELQKLKEKPRTKSSSVDIFTKGIPEGERIIFVNENAYVPKVKN
jgi:hypothetical protein